ncbi:dolichyl-diphosphooligosaccharide--protein glycosyltransferase subunit 1 [Coemansia sp. RSA 1200]|nr:dolichyl-diphosphooligosaccharide--protein glycosyltransferase subunit 1 [Coemansia sp. RSA 1200]
MKPVGMHFPCVVALCLMLFVRTLEASGLVNTNMIRTVRLTQLPFVHEQVGVVVQNEHASKAFKTYTALVDDEKATHLASIKVHERKSGAELETVQVDGGRYRATLRRALQPGEKISLNIETVFVNTVEARPARVKQTEDQFWEWADAPLVPSAYATRKQKTAVHVPSREAATTFGPYFDSNANTTQISVAFKSNNEQLEALTHRREYFVSHWADDLNVLEHYQLRSRAPENDGPFDKVAQTVSKYMKVRDNFVKTLLVKVPADAREMYAVDEIGNVSTSAVSGRRHRAAEDGGSFKIMQLRPRYPLLGGWNYTWWHGYSVPLSSHLRTQGARHRLKVPFVGSIAGCAAADDQLSVAMAERQNAAVAAYELRVVLPEGAANIDVRMSLAADSVRKQPFSYYFDSSGRTVVVIKRRNLPPDAAHQSVLVIYDYSVLSLWQKPLVIAAAIFALFMLGSAVNRLHFGLADKNHKKKSKKQQQQEKTLEFSN